MKVTGAVAAFTGYPVVTCMGIGMAVIATLTTDRKQRIEREFRG